MKKVLLIIGAAIVLLIAAIAFLISPIAESFIEKNSKDLIGRKVEMENLSLNILSGRLKIEDFTLFEADETTPFVTFNLFDVNVNLKGLLTNKIEIEHVLLSNANIRVIQKGDYFNFNDIIDFFSDTTETDTIEEPSSWDVIINDINLAHNDLYYQDQEVGSEWNLKDISIQIPGIDLSDIQADMGLQLDFMNGGKLMTKVKYDTEKSLYDLYLNIQNFKLSPILPYLQQSLAVNSLDGTFSTDLTVKGSTEHIMEFDVNGDILVSEFNITDAKDQSVASFDSISTTINHVDMTHNKFELKKLHIDGLTASYEIFKDNSDNFSKLFKEDATSDTIEVATNDNASEEPISIIINDLKVNNAKFIYADNTLPQKFVFNVDDICVAAQDFDLNKQNNVNITAVLENTGKLKIKWIGSIEDISNQNITVTLNNLAIREFSPYSLALFGNPITDGHISIQSQNIIVNNNLRGTNKVNIFNPKIGDKDNSVKAEYNIPLKMGIYILTDKNGKVDLDLPVSGNIDSPDFSYGKIIIKTLGNLLVKVAASPFNALKSGSSDIEQIYFTATTPEFSDEEYAQFAELGNLLHEKPELKLRLTQSLLYSHAITEYCVVELKKNMAIQDSTSLVNEYNANDLLVKEKYCAIQTKSPELTAFADQMLAAKGLTSKSKLTNEQKAVLLYESDMKPIIEKDMSWRNSLLQNYLTSKCSVADSSISIMSNLIENDTIKNFKDNFKVEWSLE